MNYTTIIDWTDCSVIISIWGYNVVPVCMCRYLISFGQVIVGRYCPARELRVYRVRSSSTPVRSSNTLIGTLVQHQVFDRSRCQGHGRDDVAFLPEVWVDPCPVPAMTRYNQWSGGSLIQAKAPAFGMDYKINILSSLGRIEGLWRCGLSKHPGPDDSGLIGTSVKC